MLQGERVRLRALEPPDVDTMHAWYQDHEFSVLDGNPYGTSRESLASFVATLTSPSFADVSLGIEDERGALIGLVRLKRVRAEDRAADFGIAIAREYWNRGYGTDATRTILRFAFDAMDLHRVALGVVDYNGRAIHVYEKCGFRHEGRERQSKYRYGGWHENIRMAILADAVRAAQAADGP